LFGQKQMSNQTSQTENQTNVRLAINLLTKEIRKAHRPEVSNNVLTNNNTDTYTLEQNEITKNEDAIISAIKDLKISKEGNKIKIDVTSIPVKNNQEVGLSTEIFIRE